MDSKRKISTGAWIFLSTVVLIVAFFMFYNSAKNASEEVKRQENIRELREAEEKATRNSVNADAYSKCLDIALESYNEQWAEKVKTYGSTDGKIPQDDAEFLDNRYENDKDECRETYPSS